MARVFVTGSTTGLGLGATRQLLDEGHEVTLHARDDRRAAELAESLGRDARVVVGDLADTGETDAVAEQVNRLGRQDAVIHNAGVYLESHRVATSDGHARVLAVNALAPYRLTALIQRPQRLVYVSSGAHESGDASLRDIDWTARPWRSGQAYSDSKLYVTTLAAAVARRWPEVASSAVDPGWVPTRMGGPGAPDDLTEGHVTQCWLAVSDDPEATEGGGYWYHRRRRPPHPAVEDTAFQDRLLDTLAELTGVPFPAS
ncbi:SDR family NAD(P)-dependent oxidoreductase [Streptomyces hainanensis]|uniref:SDR family NAD(P)-dependent oxidoreductase n=1 Tax=Streptomyces hainanensis TaxID=402648 RepID=A0A4R4SZ02_9ACTN|nr:SDR family NAD(P)-dependent oxidoreductase [Streptomyces hainanensis]TDC67772.1 SDR family NAD(P)-dependent oxidoreductase [Streptomyces hainanensis]